MGFLSKKEIAAAEKIFKGLGNHWRLRILHLINKEAGLPLWQITERLGGSVPTISEHTRRLLEARLITKKYRGKQRLHFLSDEGKGVLKMIRGIIDL